MLSHKFRLDTGPFIDVMFFTGVEIYMLKKKMACRFPIKISSEMKVAPRPLIKIGTLLDRLKSGVNKSHL